ncbi:hypothetical protein GSH19_04265 [Lactobacillus sp. S2-2]|uniref:hypothetical protein n=1 Tax=Lactobacillus sp. S2-2 TaxID=2692917 RepID=UPI001F3075B2|nr:hypothetical protein [Lactobacillus sp. S2-2]MCF6515368.1 hypothetical protein [Lactobacillus sp. S2-2]
MEINYKQIIDKQNYDNKYLLFDPDSSPETWKYFIDLNKHGEFSFLEKFDLESIDYKIQNNFNRLIAKSNKFSIEGLEITGDTDFNFNDNKYPYFWKKLVEGDGTLNDFKNLEFCIEMHHNLLNFSLMPRTGGLNSTKGVQFGDRFDKFIYQLSVYFTSINKEETEIGKRNNKIVESNYNLRNEFLDSFDSIYDYCKQVYLIDDSHKDFVKRLIESGKTNTISNINDVRSYINLAMEYWKIKREYIENIK